MTRVETTQATAEDSAPQPSIPWTECSVKGGRRGAAPAASTNARGSAAPRHKHEATAASSRPPPRYYPHPAGASALLAVASPSAAMLRHTHAHAMLAHVLVPHAHHAPHREHCRAYGHDRHHGLHEAHERIPSPDVLHAPFVQFDLAGGIPGRHGGAVDPSRRYPSATRDKLSRAHVGRLPQQPRPRHCSGVAQAIGKLPRSLYND